MGGNPWPRHVEQGMEAQGSGGQQSDLFEGFISVVGRYVSYNGHEIQFLTRYISVAIENRVA